MSRENKNQNLIMKLKKIFAGISLFALVITLTSAVPFNGYDKSKIETIKKFNMDAAYEKYDNFSKDGKYAANFEGDLMIHGINKKVSASGQVEVAQGKPTIIGEFSVKLAHYLSQLSRVF